MIQDHHDPKVPDDTAVEAVARALAATPLHGCMDEEGLAVYLRHIWPTEAGQASLDATLRSLAQIALAVARSSCPSHLQVKPNGIRPQ